MNYLQRILLVEDSRDDVELVTAALDAFHLTDRIDVVRDGAAALDYLECRGAYERRTSGVPAFVLLDLKLPKIGGLEVLIYVGYIVSLIAGVNTR